MFNKVQIDCTISSSATDDQSIRIIVEPADIVTQVGSYVNISVVVSSPAPTFQWYNQYGIPILNECQSNLRLGPVSREDFGFYRLQIKDSITNEAVLTEWIELKNSFPELTSDNVCHRCVNFDYAQQPTVLKSPEGVFVQGSQINLTAHFKNALFYQWFKDGFKLEGCTGNTLMINNANIENTGNYVIVATNRQGIESRLKTIIIIIMK